MIAYFNTWANEKAFLDAISEPQDVGSDSEPRKATPTKERTFVMEWYFGNGIDDLVVPNDDGSDRLPSPDSWSKWGITASESCFQSSNKCYSMYPECNKQVNLSRKGLFDEGEMATLADETSVCQGMSKDYLQRNQDYHQLDDLQGLQQMDDIFLISLLDDHPRGENVHKSFIFHTDSSGMLATDSIRNLKLQSSSSSVHSAGSCKYLKAHGFSPELGTEKGHATISQIIPCNLERNECMPLKVQTGKFMPPSEQGSMHDGVDVGMHDGLDDETSVEESVLQGLEMVMAQLTEKTRICFRDALYRLADNSKGSNGNHSQDGDLTSKEPCSRAAHDNPTWSGSKMGTESETNTIDRAVASLMFSEIAFNAEDLSRVSSPDSKLEFSGGSHLYHNSVWSHDAEVPTHGQRNVHKNFTSGAGGKRKTPMTVFGSAT